MNKKLTETEAKFVSKMEQAHQLREFRPSKVTFVRPDRSWNIQGCASFEGDQTGKAMVAGVHARWGDSRWHLSPIAIDLFGSEKKMAPRQCLLAEEKPVSTIHAAPTRTATTRNTHK